MQIVINIKPQIVDTLNNENEWTALLLAELQDIINNGTPLPKGHGRIGDLDALQEELSSWGMNDYEPSDFIDAIDQADTIIEADKAESEVEG